MPKKNDYRTRVTIMLIRRAFTDLLREKPIQNISIKELCESAGINRGTFYSHYSDIFDLLKKMEDELLQDFEDALKPLLDAEGKDINALKITTGIFRCLRDNADICAISLGPFGDKEFLARIINIGREKCLETYPSFFAGVSQKKLEYFYTFVSAGCIGLIEKWILEGMRISIDEISKMSEDIMINGIGFLTEQTDNI